MNVATAFIANKAGNPLIKSLSHFPQKIAIPKIWMVKNKKNKYKREVKHK
jgi:hypothetical protein